MESAVKNTAIKKVVGLPEEQVSKILIFISGLEAGCKIKDEPQHQTAKAKKNVRRVTV